MYVGKGLPPVPIKLAKIFRAGGFVDMGELLPEVLMPKEEGELDSKRRCGRRVTDICTWIQSFKVYVSIRGMHSPGSIPELMAYMSLIIRVSREYAGMAWWNYDLISETHHPEARHKAVGNKHHSLRKMFY